MPASVHSSGYAFTQRDLTMIEIFQTNVQSNMQAEEILKALRLLSPGSAISFELDDPDRILRIKESKVDDDLIITTVNGFGFECKVVPDVVCPDSRKSSEKMNVFWESSFDKHQTMWGLAPSSSAIAANEIFLREGIKDVLIPGIGYGRNGFLFFENGMRVTGIEISQTAVDLAEEHYGKSMHIYHGSVTDMPFDNHQYDGIFCHGLIYLLNSTQRAKLLRDCYNQLVTGGWMIFSVISKNTPSYGKGKKIDEDTFEIGDGGRIFFYDIEAVKSEFGNYGLKQTCEIDEQFDKVTGKPAFRFIMAVCRKT